MNRRLWIALTIFGCAGGAREVAKPTLETPMSAPAPTALPAATAEPAATAGPAKPVRYVRRWLEVPRERARKLQSIVIESSVDPSERRTSIIEAIGDLVKTDALPAWLQLQGHGEHEVDILHLAPPMFFSDTEDGDVFYGNRADESDLTLVKGEPFEEARLPLVKHLDPSWTVVLTDILWCEGPPETMAAFVAVLESADEVLFIEDKRYIR